MAQTETFRALFRPRVLWIYLLLGVLLSLPMMKDILFNVRLTTLNRLRPQPESLQYLVNVAEGRESPVAARMEEHRFYYEKVAAFVPGRAEAYGLLGFCSYKMGFEDDAVRAYAKSREIMPHFFWYPYNLGVIQFQRGEYAQAAQTLQDALNKDPKASLLFIMSSQQLYFPIVVNITKDPEDFYLRLLKGDYDTAYRLIVLSLFRAGQFPQLLYLADQAVRQNFKGLDFFYYYAGRAAYELSQFPQAASLLRMGLEIQPQHPDLADALAQVLAAMKQDEAAAKLKLQSQLLKTNSPALTYEFIDAPLRLF